MPNYSSASKSSVEEVEFLEIGQKETFRNFEKEFYENRSRSFQITYVSYILFAVSIFSMIWFVWMPACEKYQSAREFFHSVPFFFLLSWSVLAGLILYYFLKPSAPHERSPYHMVDDTQKLTIALLEAHIEESTTKSSSASHE